MRDVDREPQACRPQSRNELQGKWNVEENRDSKSVDGVINVEIDWNVERSRVEFELDFIISGLIEAEFADLSLELMISVLIESEFEVFGLD